MTHGPGQAIFGLGRPATNVPANAPGTLDPSEDNDLASIADDTANAGFVDATSIASSGVDSAEIAAGAVDNTHLSGGFLKQAIVAGVNETSTNVIAVTGMAVGDELVHVAVIASTANVATITQRALTDFTVGAAKMTVGAHTADNSSNSYLITWLDLT
jgi:hypothetical protein